MAYLGSDDIIRIFPSTRRTFESANSRQVTEANLTVLINKLVDVDSFVISSGNGICEFNIHGYYFKINQGSLETLASTNNWNDIYATITIDTSSNIEAFYELDGQDTQPESSESEEETDGTGYYQGLDFTGTPVNNENTYTLHLFTKVDEAWIVPPSSIIKFLPSSVDITLIDGGEI